MVRFCYVGGVSVDNARESGSLAEVRYSLLILWQR